MSLRKRLRRIEISLKPLDAVLLWLKEMLDFGQERYWEEMLADPRNPRIVVAKMVGEAVRENLSYPPLKSELLEQAVRGAMKEADMRMVLILELHDYVRSACNLNRPYCELLLEKSIRILVEHRYLGKFDPQSLGFVARAADRQTDQDVGPEKDRPVNH
jgi:hypothetical protein